MRGCSVWAKEVRGTASGRQCVYQGPREARRCRVERSIGVDRSALPRVTGRKTLLGGWIEGNLIEPEPMAASPTTCDVGKIDRPLAGDLRMAQGPVAWGPWVPKILRCKSHALFSNSARDNRGLQSLCE